MSAPSYNHLAAPLKNLHAILRYLGFTRLEKTMDTAIVQFLQVFVAMNWIVPAVTATSITTAGAGTYTAAALLNGLISRDPNGGDRTDTTDTAANIIAGLGLTRDYQEAFCTVQNAADAAETITLAGGVGVTLQDAITIARYSAAKLAIMRTSSSTVVIRSV